MNPYATVTLKYDGNGTRCQTPTCDVQHTVNQTLWPDHCIINTTDASFSAQLNTDSDDVIVRKGFDCDVDSYSAFFDNGGFTHTELDAILKKHSIDTVVVTGLALDYCVYYTSRDAKRLGYTVYTVLDASRPVSNATKETALKDLREHGVHLIQSADLAEVFSSLSSSVTSPMITWTIVTSLTCIYHAIIV